MPWIKLPTKILDNYKIGRLPDRLWRRYIEMHLAAGKNGTDGTLPELDVLGWILRFYDREALTDELAQLAEAGLIEQSPWWHLPDFQNYRPPFQGENWQQLWRRAIMERDKWICQYCGAPAEHIDHVIPRCQGGTDDLANLVAACASCNCSKGGRTPEEAGMTLRKVPNAIT